MGTPRRAVHSSTAPTQRRTSNMTARTWPCSRTRWTQFPWYRLFSAVSPTTQTCRRAAKNMRRRRTTRARARNLSRYTHACSRHALKATDIVFLHTFLSSFQLLRLNIN
ncbi:hypothetical protein PO909_005210 [Leuciscus waleckii]